MRQRDDLFALVPTIPAMFFWPNDMAGMMTSDDTPPISSPPCHYYPQFPVRKD